MAIPQGAPRGQTLKELDDLLQCGICFDYFNIAMMIPQCSHNYCSLCIRKFLSYKTQCPTCCVTVTEPDLRNNRILDDLVKAYVTARNHLSQLILDSPPSPPQDPSAGKLAASRSQGCTGKQIKQENKSMDKFLVKRNMGTSNRTSHASVGKTLDGHLSAPSCSTVKVKEEPGVSEVSATDSCAADTPSTSLVKVKVECPVCGVGILEQYINNHLDGCLNRDEKKDSLRSSIQKRKPMAKVVYNLLSDRDLRKRMKVVGLNTRGSKQQMIRRHQEFVHMFNSQCDSLNPKSAAEIVQEIEKNEKIRSILEAKQERGMAFSKEQSEEQIDEIHQEYRTKHKSDFHQLIEQMKGRWKMSTGKKGKEEPADCDGGAGDLNKEDTGPSEEPNPDNELLHENMEESFLRAENVSIIRSSSPVFPLSSHSRASSSSDILRDIEEAASLQESNPALDPTGPKAKKRKAPPSRDAQCKQQTSRGKRQRK